MYHCELCKEKDAQIAALEEALAYAIAEAEGWYDESRGRSLAHDDKEIFKAKVLLDTSDK